MIKIQTTSHLSHSINALPVCSLMERTCCRARNGWFWTKGDYSLAGVPGSIRGVRPAGMPSLSKTFCLNHVDPQPAHSARQFVACKTNIMKRSVLGDAPLKVSLVLASPRYVSFVYFVCPPPPKPAIHYCREVRVTQQKCSAFEGFGHSLYRSVQMLILEPLYSIHGL